MFLSNSSFLVKLQLLDWRPARFLDKKWQRCRTKAFPKFYRELSCRNHLGKSLWRSPGYSFLWNIFWKKSAANSGCNGVAVCTTQTCNFLNKLCHRNFSENFLNFHNQLFFTTPPFVLRNQITWKITCQSGEKPPPFALIRRSNTEH